MIIMNLVDISCYEKNCGFLICENEEVTCSIIQNKINEIKNKMELEGLDWMIDNIISEIPAEWRVKFYDNQEVVRI